MIDVTKAGAFIPTLWENRIQYAGNNRRGLTRLINDTGSRWFGPGGTIKWPIMQVWPAAVALANPLVVQDTAQNIGSSDITPSVITTYAQLQEPAALTGLKDLIPVYAPTMAESLYQKIDVDIATLFQSAVASVGGAVEWNEGDFLSGISTLLGNGGDKVEIGNIYGVYHTAKWDAILATGNIVSAAIRGETNSAAKTGIVEMAYGVKLFFTKNVTTSTTLRNAIFVRDAIWMARKNRPKIELERDLHNGMVTKIVGSTMYGVAYLHKSTTPQFSSDLLVAHLTTTT
jgi:hypothetical protein